MAQQGSSFEHALPECKGSGRGGSYSSSFRCREVLQGEGDHEVNRDCPALGISKQEGRRHGIERPKTSTQQEFCRSCDQGGGGRGTSQCIRRQGCPGIASPGGLELEG